MDDKVKIEELPFAERARKYRALAEDALARAEEARLKVHRDSFIQIAGHWHALATEAEQAAKDSKES